MGTSTTYYRAVVLGDSPRAYYPLDDAAGSTTARDLSGHGYTGTYGTSGLTLGAAALLPGGDPGSRAAISAGSGAIVQLPAGAAPATGAQPWSLEAWVAPQSSALDGNYHEIVGFGTAGTNKEEAGLYLHGGNVIFTGYADDSTPPTPALIAGTVHHLAATYDGVIVRVYLDGALAATKTTTLAVVSGGVWIGRSVSFGGQDLLAATIAHVALYTTALTATQVQTHYLAGTQQNGPYHAAVSGALVNVVANTLNVQNQIGQRSTASVSLWGPLGTLWQYGTAISIYDGTGALAYAGFIQHDKAYRDAGARQGDGGYLSHDLTLMDNCYKADKRVIWYSNVNVPAGQIFQDLINRVLYQEGVTYTAQSVAGGITVPEVIWNGKQISTCFNWLAKNSGYWWNIDVNGVAWFQPYAGTPAPIGVIDGTQVDSIKNLFVTTGNEQYVNTQYTQGGFSEKGSKTSPLDETFHGNSVTRSFTLSYPVSRIYAVILNGTDVTATSLTKGSNGGKFYYAPGDAVIAQDPAQTLLGSGDTLEIKYAGRVPAIGKAQNSALIAAQKARESGAGSGIIESVYRDTKVHTLNAALQTAAALLAHYGADMTVLDFDILEAYGAGLAEGQMLTVNLPDFALASAHMLVMSVAINDQVDGINIWYHVTAVGSPYDAAQWQTYWQNLMDQQSDPSDLADTSDAVLTPIVTMTDTRAPTDIVRANPGPVTSPICGVTSGPHTMVCGNWVCS